MQDRNLKRGHGGADGGGPSDQNSPWNSAALHSAASLELAQQRLQQQQQKGQSSSSGVQSGGGGPLPVEAEEERPQQVVEGVSSRLLPLLMAAGLVGGAALGFAIRATDNPWTSRQIMYVGFPGELFSRMMSGVSLPLISSSVVAALGSSRLPVIGRIGLCSLFLSLLCKCLAAGGAVALTVFLSPGSTVRLEVEAPKVRPSVRTSLAATDRLLDLVRNLFPSNIIEAHMYTRAADAAEDVATLPGAGSGHGGPTLNVSPTANHVGILSFSILLGLVLAAFRDDQNVVLNVFVSLSNTVMTATHMLLWFAPVGLCSTSMALVLGARHLHAVAADLSMYVMAYVAAIALHSLVLLPALYLMLTRRHLGPFYRNMIYPVSVALGTASSSATVPTVIVALEEGLQMDPRLARFLAPLGATLNMDGSTIYLTVTLLFLAQKNAIAFTAGQYLTIGLLCGLSSLSTGSSREANIWVLVYLMHALDIPVDDIEIIFYADWIMDRLSTAVNVLGDAVVASGTQVMCRSALAHSKEPADTPAKEEEAIGSPQ
ncbi:excitatory amino acid transporter-like [Amblyomma americanum]